MKYLSDTLYVIFDSAYYKDMYLEYEVYNIYPYNGDETEWFLYTGHIYGTGEKIPIYLNDIVASYAYDWSYAYKPTELKNILHPHTKNYAESGTLFKTKVYFPEINLHLYVDSTEYIMNYYKDSKTPRGEDIPNLINTSESKCWNLLNQRTNILPRIPRLSYETNNFWLGGLFAITQEWQYNSMYEGDPIYAIAGVYNNIVKDELHYDNGSFIIPLNITGEDYKGLTDNAEKIMFTGVSYDAPVDEYNADISKGVDLAYVDECPADYYLIWIDRTGGYQSQPFTGKVTLTEDISTKYKYDIINTESPIEKSVVDNWSLNSNWLTYDEYKAYESIFTSKYLYLFNTKLDEGYEVIIDNKSWTEKVKENKDKMFNLNIECHSALPQKILY